MFVSNELKEYEATVNLTFKVKVGADSVELAEESVFDYLGNVSVFDADNTEVNIKEIKS